ncbi:prokineticin receptor 1-like isoform X3 [Mytilus californianus]|uniref:prokineticin receptor 1-like isoform X3 n=1 Tax=Mytilus californianus TaxID=6549 RepID=UPI002245D658|nr:prokineticin receptor 1-like isoform X3 [Mytilus californianus]
MDVNINSSVINVTNSLETGTNDILLAIIISGWICVAEGILTVIFNGLVIVLLVRRNIKSNMSFLLLNLAIADLSVAVLHDFPRAVQQHYNWTYGRFLCVSFMYTQDVALFASTFLLVSLSVDRLVVLARPLWTGRQKILTRSCMVLIPWITAIYLSTPFLKSGLYRYRGQIWCTPFFAGLYGKVWLPIRSALLVIIPGVVMVTIYGYIAYIIRVRKRNGYVTTDSEVPDVLRTNQSRALSNAMKRSILITFVVGIAFILCWLPSSLATYTNLISVKSLGGAFYIMTALSPLNSLINPIIVLSINHRMFRPGRKATLSTKLTLTTSLKSPSRSRRAYVNALSKL